MIKFPVPAEVKPIAHLLKIADDHESRNIVVTYWARRAAYRLAMRLFPGERSPETANLLIMIFDWLEEFKKANSDNEGITNQTTAHALIEEYALCLLEQADKLDKESIFNKNTVKAFYTAGLVIDILVQFENVEDVFKEKRRFAKWKAAYIHNCLKNGEIPVSGPRDSLFLEDINDGMLHISQIDPEDLKNYTIYKGPDVPQEIAYPDGNGGHVLYLQGLQQAQLYCKYATSALNYVDVKHAVDYLTIALELLKMNNN